MKKLLTVFIPVIAIFLCACTSDRYKATGLIETNDGSGWNCTFESLDGDLSKGFNINSKNLRIESSVSSGKMTVYVTGNGENLNFDGSALDESIPVERFGEGVLYVTLKCEDAKDGKIRIVWESDE